MIGSFCDRKPEGGRVLPFITGPQTGMVFLDTQKPRSFDQGFACLHAIKGQTNTARPAPFINTALDEPALWSLFIVVKLVQLDVVRLAMVTAMTLARRKKCFCFVRAARINAPLFRARNHHRRVIGFGFQFSLWRHSVIPLCHK